MWHLKFTQHSRKFIKFSWYFHKKNVKKKLSTMWCRTLPFENLTKNCLHHHIPRCRTSWTCLCVFMDKIILPASFSARQPSTAVVLRCLAGMRASWWATAPLRLNMSDSFCSASCTKVRRTTLQRGENTSSRKGSYLRALTLHMYWTVSQQPSTKELTAK